MLREEETFTQGADGKLIWKADNADIYYQGTTNEKPPVGVKISYQLDGKPIKAEDLAGQSGELTMTIQYENDACFEDEVDGKRVEMNAPFLMTSAIILPVDTFSEVTVSQGKLVSEGSNQILVVYGMPGFADSLKLSEDMKEELENKIGDTVIITATVRNFSMGSIYTVASSNEFSDIDLGEDSDMEDLGTAVNDLVAATDDLISSSSDLSEGLGTLKDSFKTYAAGVKTVNEGVSDLSDGAGKLSKGIKQYTNGVTTLTSGASQYVTGTNQLVSGVNQYVAGEQLIDAGATSLYNGAKDFPSQYEQFQNGLSAYVSAVNNLPATMGKMVANQVETITQSYNDTLTGASTDQAESAVKADMETNVETMAADFGWTQEEKAAVKQAMYQAIAGGAQAQKQVDIQYVQSVGNTVKENVSGMTDLNNNADMKKLIQSGNTLVNTSADKIQPGIASVTDGIKELYDGVKELSSENETLLNGTAALSSKGGLLTEGIQSLTAKSKTLNSSAVKLSKGAKTLSKGTKKIDSVTKEVAEGVAQLQSGSVSLLEGMNQFKDEGTGKLQSEYNDKIQTILDRFKAITASADDYNTFSGIADDMQGSVKFIFQTEEINTAD